MARSTSVLRLLAVAALLLLAYFAQYLFDQGTLQELYPPWLLERLPFLQPTTLWLAEDLYTLALWLLGLSALLFGLLVPGWEAQPSASAAHADPAGGHAGGARPWLWLLVILLVAGVLAAWGWTNLPIAVDRQVARSGLQAQALLEGTGSGWLAPGATGAPQISYLPTALAMFLSGLLSGGDPGSGLAALHLVGLLGALGTVFATYLLALELFASSPQRRGMAVLAAGFAGAAVALYHFGRLPIFLPATALGVLAGWALLRGRRTASLPLVAASGILAALALWLDRSGLVFAPVLFLWWLGLRLQGPFSWRLVALWLGAYAVFAAPLLLTWLFNPATFGAYLHGGAEQAAVLGDWWANLRTTAATLFWTGDASPLFGYDGHFIASVVAPLFVLGVGALLLNLDRLVGWCLLTWLGGVLLLASAVSPLAPLWPLLLPLLPVVGITIVFALERIAALWVLASRPSPDSAPAAAPAAAPAGASASTADSAPGSTPGSTPGSAPGSASASLAGGLLVAAAVLAWIGYYEFAGVRGDAPSYTGRALAGLSPNAVALLVATAPAANTPLDDPVLQFLGGPRVNQALAVGIDALPATLPQGSLVLVQGNDPTALSAARARYPGAELAVTRDLQANPRLFVLKLP